MYQPFKVVRLPKHRGGDKRGDIFCVQAKANFELVRTGESQESALLNGTTDRTSAVQLCNSLNEAWSTHYA